MKKTAGVVTFSCMLLLIAMSSTLRAETLTASVLLTPDAEVAPPIPTPSDASGIAYVTIDISRDGAGNIIGASANFSVTFNFRSNITISGLHIHQGSITNNGPVVIDSGLGGTNTLTFASGAGRIELRASSVSLTVLRTLLTQPAGHYVNLHTSVNPSGAIRGQIVKLTETLGTTVPLTTNEEVSPSAPLPIDAGGTATITINPVRRPLDGVIVGGAVTFTATLSLPQNSTITGFHIHEGAAGTNGGIVIDSRVSGSNSISVPTGQTTISFPIRLAPAEVAVLQRLIQNPGGFYANVHTSVNGSGVVRGQLRPLAPPPAIQQSNTVFLTAASTPGLVGLSVSNVDFGSSVLINGQAVSATPNLATGELGVIVPPFLRATAGTLFVQVQNFLGQRSAPYAIVVAPVEMVNDIPATTVDSAKWEPLVAPEMIAAAFGTRLASTTVGNLGMSLQTILGGTSVYVNGAPAFLFYASEGQVNYLVPGETLVGPGRIVIVSGDGTVSLGGLPLAGTSPAIFTRLGDGTGAPSAVATTDGVNYIQVSDDAGNPVPIQAGTFLMLFTTGTRFPSTPVDQMTVMIGGTNVTPLYFGAQGQFFGLEQVNIQIPQSLAGRGDVDLVINLDGKMSNSVRINIK